MYSKLRRWHRWSKKQVGRGTCTFPKDNSNFWQRRCRVGAQNFTLSQNVPQMGASNFAFLNETFWTKRLSDDHWRAQNLRWTTDPEPLWHDTTDSHTKFQKRKNFISLTAALQTKSIGMHFTFTRWYSDHFTLKPNEFINVPRCIISKTETVWRNPNTLQTHCRNTFRPKNLIYTVSQKKTSPTFSTVTWRRIIEF